MPRVDHRDRAEADAERKRQREESVKLTTEHGIMQLHGEEEPAACANGHATHHDNNNLVNGLDAVKLRNTGSKHLPNGHLSPVRDRSPSRDRPRSLAGAGLPVAPQLYDKIKWMSSVAQTAQDQIRDLQLALRDTLADSQPSAGGPWPRSSPPPSPSRSPTARSPGGRKQLPDKEFVVRNSPLTDLFVVNHIRTIYHVAVVVLIILFLNTLVHDLVTHGSVDMSIGLLWHSFGGFHRVITIWLVMMLAVSVQYVAFTNWAQKRRVLPAGKWVRASWDAAGVAALVLFDVALVTVPVLRMLHYDLPFASSFAILMECVRLLMKTHAFVRANAPRALRDGVCPGFSHFLYFLFAPTLVYSDNYPRTAQIRWRVVACHLLEVVGCTFYNSFLAERYVLPLFRDFGRQPMTLLDLSSLLLSAVLPSGLAFVCSFYLLLHSWMNAWAEMLRFGDRMFYKDWWNQSSFSSYYRTWNVLVQDWLFTYVYKDVVLLGGNGLMARLAVFCISAVVHEFILGFTLRFFYPALYVFFGVIGLLLSFVAASQERSSAVGNVGLWLSLFLGDGILIGVYAMEYYARQNCAQIIDSSWDLFVPRSWSCVGNMSR